jgi:hypothetical protein
MISSQGVVRDEAAAPGSEPIGEEERFRNALIPMHKGA